MREDKIIQFMKNTPHPHPLADLAKAFGVSKRTIANDLKLLNELGKTSGFQVINLRGKGYKIEVIDEKRFHGYCHQIQTDQGKSFLSPQSRKENLELLLLFATEYVTLQQLAQTLEVSISTVKNDLSEVRYDFDSMQLSIVSKAHYGYKVNGPEEKRRLFIIQLLRNDLVQPIFTKDYTEFADRFDYQGMKAFLIKRSHALQIRVNDLVLENLVQHILLLVFRIKQHNLLKDHGEVFEVQDNYTQLAEDIAGYIAVIEGIQLPDNERLYLSRQLFGKILTFNDPKQHQILTRAIRQALQQIDEKYRTIFHKDTELIDALAFHVAPLLQRLYMGHQIENPIIDDVYTRYANVFNIAFEFIDEVSEDAKIVISKDEAGYLAIYFAASLEKQLHYAREQYRKIAVICGTGGGASYFVKTKLEQIFTNAKVKTFALTEVRGIDCSYDLIITTVPVKVDFGGIPIIQTQALLTDKEINKIQKDLLLLQENSGEKRDIDQQLLSLFSAENFHITSEKNYLQIITEQGFFLETNGWAAQGYTTLVLEREALVDTIYDQGIAGPHPMESRAIKECINVIFCKGECSFHNKPVKLIFLINITNDHLFLHKEISRLMIKIMEDTNSDTRITMIENAAEFFFYIEELIKKG